jgi:hypothetical protein
VTLPITEAGRVLGLIKPKPVFFSEEMTLATAATLPAPPAARGVPAVKSWGMDGNDEYGDCVICGFAHSLNAWDHLVGIDDVVPSLSTCISQYCASTGCVSPGDANDTGLLISDMLPIWQSEGLFNPVNKIVKFAQVNHQSLLEIHQSVAAYGVCLVGVNLPQSAEDQFDEGKPWTPAGDAPIGGHCIVIVGYNAQWLYAVTWGRVVAISWSWWLEYGMEAWVIIPQAFAEAGHGPEQATTTLANLEVAIATLNGA